MYNYLSCKYGDDTFVFFFQRNKKTLMLCSFVDDLMWWVTEEKWFPLYSQIWEQKTKKISRIVRFSNLPSNKVIWRWYMCKYNYTLNVNTFFLHMHVFLTWWKRWLKLNEGVTDSKEKGIVSHWRRNQFHDSAMKRESSGRKFEPFQHAWNWVWCGFVLKIHK